MNGEEANEGQTSLLNKIVSAAKKWLSWKPTFVKVFLSVAVFTVLSAFLQEIINAPEAIMFVVLPFVFNLVVAWKIQKLKGIKILTLLCVLYGILGQVSGFAAAMILSLALS